MQFGKPRYDTFELKCLRRYIPISNNDPKPKFFLRCNFLELGRSYVSLFIMRIHKADYTVDNTDCSGRWGDCGERKLAVEHRYSAAHRENDNFISSRIIKTSVPLTYVHVS